MLGQVRPGLAKLGEVRTG